MTMSDDLTPYGGKLQPLGIQQLMTQSLQVFRFYEEFETAFGLSHEATRLAEIDNTQFVALKRATNKEARFNIHCEAYDLHDHMPSNEKLLSALKSVKKAMAMRPSEEDRALLVGKVLDFWMINADLAAEYGFGLVWKLADCPKQTTERLFPRRKEWLPIPVIAGAFNRLIDTYRPAYGKPPHLPDVLEECGRQSDRLIRLHDQIANLGRTRFRLGKIIEATDDSYPDEFDD